MTPFPHVLPKTKDFATRLGVDLAIPRCMGSGIGNALVYTRLVEDWSRINGRPVTIATAPLQPSVGTVSTEDPFALWRNNPFISKIVNALKIDPDGYEAVDLERRSLVQVNHIVENSLLAIANGLSRIDLFLAS